MRLRPSARLILLDPSGRVLLFRFAFKDGPLTGQTYWATPGGALDDGESFEDAARRELAEETGILTQNVGASIGSREVEFVTPSGERVRGQERYFLVRCGGDAISRENWTALERAVMAEHRWWPIDEILESRETIYPEDLAAMIAAADKPS